MAATKYQVFCRCINSVTGKAVSNKDTREWVSAFDEEERVAIEDDNLYVRENVVFCTKGSVEESSKVQEILIDSFDVDNPKFDMLFIYNGCGIKYSSGKSMPYLLADKYSRMKASPVFVHSTTGSLKAAMEKAQALTNKVGHENIMLGKVVDLTQYIDIV